MLVKSVERTMGNGVKDRVEQAGVTEELAKALEALWQAGKGSVAAGKPVPILVLLAKKDGNLLTESPDYIAHEAVTEAIDTIAQTLRTMAATGKVM